MRFRRLVAFGAGLLLAGSAASGCSESTPDEGRPRQAAVLEQVIRVIVDDRPDDPENPDAVPVAFVMGIDGTLSIEVQASVAAGLVDDVDVRFVDERAEAIDDGDEQAVREGGILLVVGDIHEEGPEVDVEVERYVTFEERDRVIVSLRFRDPDWTVTSTVVPPPAVD